MSFSQWTFSGSGTAVETSISSIADTSSLRLAMPGAIGSAVMGLTTGANVTVARIRTLFKVTSTNANYAFGIFGMMQSSITSTSNGYFAALSDTNSLIYIIKGACSNLTDTTGSTVLNSAANGFSGNVLQDTIYALELEWQYDSGNALVYLIARTGTATNFSDLVQRVTAIDNVSPYTTGVSAGVAHRQSAINLTRDVYFDNTSIYTNP